MSSIQVLKNLKSSQKANSNFHFVLNPNISHYEFNNWTKEKKLAFIDACKDLMTHFKDNFNLYCKNDISPIMPKVIDMSVNFEVGEIKKFIHLDSFMRINTYCQIDLSKTRDLIKSRLSPYSRGSNLKVSYIHDSIASTQRYALKDGNRLI